MMDRKFNVNVQDGKFTFDPEQPWVYLPDDTVQWVSETGKMTILVGGHVEYPSPFDDLRDSDEPAHRKRRTSEIKGRRFETDEPTEMSAGTQAIPKRVWKTRAVKVRNVFPPRQQLLRRLAAAGSLKYDFTFEVTREDTKIVYVKTFRGLGSMC
jgi:hypothetical protein